MGSILNDIKQMLGLNEDYTAFDTDIIIHINSVFMTLQQLGIGPDEGFSITDASTKWSDFIEYPNMYEAVKSYIYVKVRMLFDPPTISSVAESLNRMASEFEVRLNLNYEMNKKNR